MWASMRYMVLSPKPVHGWPGTKLVKVKKDKEYDIIVSSGSFSSCPTCGTDYYSSLQKSSHRILLALGGGYTPDFLESRRENSTSIYRSDDLLYGRAVLFQQP